MSDQLESVTQGLAAEFAAVAEAMVGAGAQSVPLGDPIDPSWVVSCAFEGALTGTWSLYLASGDANGLAARVLMRETASESEVTDALLEIMGQAVASLVTKGTVPGLTATATGAGPATAFPGAAVGGFACRIDDTLTVRIGCAFEASATMKPAPTSTETAPDTARPSAVMTTRAASASKAPPDNLELILDIDMPLSVRFGEAILTLESLSRLGPGSLIELSREPDDPVDVLINGRLVARGEVVVVSGNYGVRVTEVVSAAERIRTINA